MPASESHTRTSAVAFQLAAALEAYEEDLAALIRRPLDPELYKRVNRHMEQMRMYAAALPSVSVAWIEVLIAHHEMTHGLWRLPKAAFEPAAVDEIQRSLQGAVARLRQDCIRMMPAVRLHA